jgi:hypothetical protein
MMEEIDNFPFDSIEDFELAVSQTLCSLSSPKGPFALAPPIHVYTGDAVPCMESPNFCMQEDKKKSPHARSGVTIKECMEEMQQMELRIEEKLEQLHTLFFFLSDKIKLLENKHK